MTEPHRVAQLNNLGVACLERGDFGHSFHLFREALASSMALGEVEAHHQPSRFNPAPTLLSNISSTSDCASWPLSSSPLRISSAAVTTDHAETARLAGQYKGEDTGSDFLAVHHFHAQGFLIEAPSASSSSCSSPLQQQGQLSLVDTTICSSIIIFNLALLHHIRAKASSTLRDQQQLTSRATSLYKNCCNLLFEPSFMDYLSSTSSGVAAHNPVLDILGMAVLTNSAHVQFELVLDFDMSEFYQYQLVRYLYSMGPSLQLRYPRESVLLVEYMEKQRANYLANLFVLKRPLVANAA
jgi:hypothetical protein